MNVHDIHGQMRFVLLRLDLPNWAAERKLLGRTAAGTLVESAATSGALVSLAILMRSDTSRKGLGRLDQASTMNVTAVLVASRRQQKLCPPMTSMHSAMALVRVGG